MADTGAALWSSRAEQATLNLKRPHFLLNSLRDRQPLHGTAAAMMFAFLFLMLAGGQVDGINITPDYEYQSGQFLDEDEALLKDYIPVHTVQEQRFLEGLIIEAGRQVLFPKLYQEDKEEANGDKNVGKMKFYGKGPTTDAEDDDGNVGTVRFYPNSKGQPEVEESYENQVRSRRGRRDCPQRCTVYKPICGTDGKMYESVCHMKKENCGSSTVTVGPWDRCRGKHYLCPTNCLDFNDPVCGSDGRIYHNICILRKRNCGKLVEALPVRKCYDVSRQSKSELECPEECQEEYKPVCGSDGVVYYNECFLRKRTCNTGIVEVEMETCVETRKCPEVCLSLYDPVCGSDGKLYVNHCRMLQENCGKEVKMMHRNFCGFVRGT